MTRLQRRAKGGAMRIAPRSCALRRLACTGLLALLSGAVAAGCGSSQPTPKRPKEHKRAARSERQQSSMGVSSSVGALNEAGVRRAFKKCMKGFMQCLNDGWDRIEFMGGSVDFYVGVHPDGSVDTYLETSTLGDRQTEKCLLDVIRAQTWPKPVGWSIDNISAALSQVQSDIDNCKQHASLGRYAATVYVDTDGSALSAGGTPPGPNADLALDCLIGVLRSVKYPSPGSYPAKVTFDL
jgi:hypothetical protein